MVSWPRPQKLSQWNSKVPALSGTRRTRVTAARADRRPDLQVGDGEPVHAVDARSAPAPPARPTLQPMARGLIDERHRGDRDHPLRAARRHRGDYRPREKGAHVRTSSTASRASSCAPSRVFGESARPRAPIGVRMPRQPRPRYGCAGSQAIGARLGCEPGAGSGKISDFAAVVRDVAGRVVVLLVDVAVEHGDVAGRA